MINKKKMNSGDIDEALLNSLDFDTLSKMISSSDFDMGQDTIGAKLSGDSAKNAMTDFFRMSECATEDIGDILRGFNLRLCVAESCTGGLLGAAITQVSGVSSWFEGGAITYSNTAKHEQLGVDTNTLQKYGAVSALTVCQMVAGVCRNNNVDVGLSISGIAGPEGVVKGKPVGTVWIGLMLPKNLNKHQQNMSNKKAASKRADKDSERDSSWILSAQLLKNAYLLRETPVLTLDGREVRAREFHFEGDRTSVRQSAALMALYFAYEYLSQ